MILADFLSHYKSQFTCDPSVAEFELISLLCKVLNTSRTHLLLEVDQSISDSDIRTLKPLVERLIQGEPLAYVLEEAYFRGERYIVKPGVLAPRPETEELVGLVESYIHHKGYTTGAVVECGAGSGVIGLALAQLFSGFDVFAWDVSDSACAVSRANQALFNVENYTFIQGDFLELRESDLELYGSPKILVSNPPYVTKDEVSRLDPSVLDYEPSEALTDNGDGLSFYRYFSLLAPQFDALFFECGEAQAPAISTFFGPEYMTQIKQDMFGKNRFVVVTKI